MKIRVPRRLQMTFIALLAAAVAYPPGDASSTFAASAEASSVTAGTLDIIHMRDGRELTGNILSEDASQIVFRYVDPVMNLETTITLQRRDVLEIERDVEMEGEPDVGEPADEGDEGPVERSRPSGLQRGLAEGDVYDESLPAFYVIPMKGQMGTDIRADAYARIVDDIRAAQPDLIVWVMECADVDELMISMSDQAERGFMHLLEDYRNLVRMLHDDLQGIRQVVWVHDSVGISSLIALAWDEMYMTPGARLTGFRAIYENAASWSDDDVAAKMIAAWVGIINGFLERGGRPLALGEAMTRPHHRLSATWRGREVTWRLDTSGEYIVNDSDERTVNFRAKAAEDFGISKGTAETLDELALLLGYREYRVIEGGAEQIISRYVENWRRQYENTQRLWADYQQHRRWATGDQTLRWLGRARNDLRNIIGAMNRYPAVELRFINRYGADRFRLEMMEEDLREQIRALNRGGSRR